MVTTTSIPDNLAEVSVAMLEDMDAHASAEELRGVVETMLAKIRPYAKHIVTVGYPTTTRDGDGLFCRDQANEQHQLPVLRRRVLGSRISEEIRGSVRLVINDKATLMVVEDARNTPCPIQTNPPHDHLLAQESWEQFPYGFVISGLSDVLEEVTVAAQKRAVLLANISSYSKEHCKLLAKF